MKPHNNKMNMLSVLWSMTHWELDSPCSSGVLVVQGLGQICVGQREHRPLTEGHPAGKCLTFCTRLVPNSNAASDLQIG